MKHALVTGAGGFIAHHLVKRLKKEGYWVRAVDIKRPEYSTSSADDFQVLDLREIDQTRKAFSGVSKIDEVYNLAADMGGMGFIHTKECEIMRNNALINSNMIFVTAEHKVSRYFFSSSACVYRDMKPGDPEVKEEEVYPALPDNEYGWEKLYAERMALAFGRRYGTEIRIARFQNCYGPEGTWQGGREKSPAAMCRKVAEASDGGAVEIWGDGSAVRSYTFVDDMVDGIYRLMQSNIKSPVNIGNPEYVTVNDLVDVVAQIAKKKIIKRYVDGPVGVLSRNFSNEKIYQTGWKAKFNLEAGIRETYPWVMAQVEKNKTTQK